MNNLSYYLDTCPDFIKDKFINNNGIIKNIFMQANTHRPIFHTLYRGLLLNGLAHLTGQDNAGYNFLF